MDDSLSRMKDFQEEGYKVIGIKINYTANVPSNMLEYQVTLEKGLKKEVICSSSNDFVNFTKHFKMIKNMFNNNNKFIYIENLDNYERQTKGLLRDQIYLEDEHIIKTMGRVFSEGIITLLFKPSSINNKTGISMFRIDLNKNVDFLCCDLKDEFKVYKKSNEKLVFTGLSKNCAVQSDNTALIVLQDMSLKMENTRLSVEFINMNPAESASTIASSMGLDFHTNLNINTKERTFIVIIPVKNLIISDGFGSVPIVM